MSGDEQQKQLSDNADSTAGTFMPVAELTPKADHNRAALAFWRSLPREPRQAPRETDCDLLQIAELLPACVIIDWDGASNWPVRLFGTALVSHFGLDATGLNAFDLYAPEDQVVAQQRLTIARERPAVMMTRTRLINLNGVPLSTEWVLMPISDDTGRVCSFLGSISALEVIASVHEQEFDGSLRGRKLVDISFGVV